MVQTSVLTLVFILDSGTGTGTWRGHEAVYFSKTESSQWLTSFAAQAEQERFCEYRPNLFVHSDMLFSPVHSLPNSHRRIWDSGRTKTFR